MKSKILYLLLSLYTFKLLGLSGDPLQKEAQKIFPITEVQYSIDYYTEQTKLWEHMLKEDPYNPESWLNIYTALRAKMILGGDDLTGKLKGIVDSMENYVPNSYERYYVECWESGFTKEGLSHALKAFAIAPQRQEVYRHLMTQYELMGLSDSVRAFAQRWKVNGDYSPGILAWNHNALMSVEQNGILLTWGDNDTYPCWLLQNSFGIRPDVTVANIHLLENHNEYRSRMLEKVGITQKTTVQNWLETLLERSNIPVYFGIGVPKQIRLEYQEDLSLTGLAFKYKEKKNNTDEILKNNIEQSFMLDYLTESFYEDRSKTVLESMNLNYLPGLILLYNYCQEKGDQSRAKKYKGIAKHIAYKAKRLNDIAQFFEEQDPSPMVIHSNLDAVAYEREMVKIATGLYASRTEMSNKKYEDFLIDLLKNKAYDLLEVCKPNKVNWKQILREKYPTYSKELIQLHMASALDTGVWSRLSDETLFPEGHPDDLGMPLHSISHEAALAYCNWISQVYNQSNDSSRRFKKVKFRLPDHQEWKIAAEYDQSIISTSKIRLPIPVKECVENSIGLLGVHENVSEMTNLPGIALGLSWEESGSELGRERAKTYEENSPSVGFRVFMEVIN